MKESEDPESTREFKNIFRRVLDVKESVSESGFDRADALRMRNFAQGSSTQSSGHVESQGLLSLFFESKLVVADLSCSAFDAWALDEAEVDFGQSLVTCPETPQKRQSLLSRWRCLSWGVSFP